MLFDMNAICYIFVEKYRDKFEKYRHVTTCRMNDGSMGECDVFSNQTLYLQRTDIIHLTFEVR